jgi:hypothetical protein
MAPRVNMCGTTQADRLKVIDFRGQIMRRKTSGSGLDIMGNH